MIKSIKTDLTKSIKLELTKCKKSNLLKDITKANFFATDFLIPGARKAFIELQKAFIRTLIFRHFNLKCYICIGTNTSRYIIGTILSQITSE